VSRPFAAPLTTPFVDCFALLWFILLADFVTVGRQKGALVNTWDQQQIATWP